MRRQLVFRVVISSTISDGRRYRRAACAAVSDSVGGVVRDSMGVSHTMWCPVSCDLFLLSLFSFFA